LVVYQGELGKFYLSFVAVQAYDLDPDPMTLIYELAHCFQRMYLCIIPKINLSVIVANKHTEKQTGIGALKMQVNKNANNHLHM